VSDVLICGARMKWIIVTGVHFPGGTAARECSSFGIWFKFWLGYNVVREIFVWLLSVCPAECWILLQPFSSGLL
jgi:hypothetical protein